MFAARGLIFDCDGTLADTMPAHFRAWTAVTQRYGLNFSEKRFYELGGVPSHRIAALLAHEQGVVIDADRLAREKEEAFLEHLAAVQAVPAVVAIARCPVWPGAAGRGLGRLPAGHHASIAATRHSGLVPGDRDGGGHGAAQARAGRVPGSGPATRHRAEMVRRVRRHRHRPGGRPCAGMVAIDVRPLYELRE